MVKKPKKKQETPETGEEVLVSAPQKPDVKSKKRKRQESKSEPVEIEAVEKPAEKDADAAERLRRALQRDIQQLVLRRHRHQQPHAVHDSACVMHPFNRLRSEGKSKAEIKSATHELKAPLVLAQLQTCTGHERFKAQHGAVSKSKSLKSSKKQKWEAPRQPLERSSLGQFESSVRPLVPGTASCQARIELSCDTGILTSLGQCCRKTRSWHVLGRVTGVESGVCKVCCNMLQQSFDAPAARAAESASCPFVRSANRAGSLT